MFFKMCAKIVPVDHMKNIAIQLAAASLVKETEARRGCASCSVISKLIRGSGIAHPHPNRSLTTLSCSRVFPEQMIFLCIGLYIRGPEGKGKALFSLQDI